MSRKDFSVSGASVGRVFMLSGHVFSNLVLLSLALQCHAQIHGAISKIDIEKDIQALIEETAVSSTENESEFLLTDYFVSIWKEVPLMGYLSHVLRDSFFKKLRATVKKVSCFSNENTDFYCSPCK